MKLVLPQNPDALRADHYISRHHKKCNVTIIAMKLEVTNNGLLHTSRTETNRISK
jgi:hypothetical protein